MAKVTSRHFFKTLALFLLNDVAEDSSEPAIVLYDRWREKYRLVVKDPKLAAWTLEYLERTRNINRDMLREAAVLDGFVPPN